MKSIIDPMHRIVIDLYKSINENLLEILKIQLEKWPLFLSNIRKDRNSISPRKRYQILILHF